MSSSMMLVMGMAAFVFCICVAVGIYFASKKDDTSTDAGSPGPAPGPAPVDPRATVWASGQKIQSAPFDTQVATTPFTTPPTGYSGTPTYTMSLDIKIAEIAPNWRNIFAHSPNVGVDGGIDSRRPSVYLSGTNQGPPANRIQVVHQIGNENTNIMTTFVAPLGAYFNLTWVVSGGTLKAYINGVLDPTGTVSGAFTWASSDQPWAWMNSTVPNKVGAITVANVYWWNSALTTSQIAQLKVPTSPTPGVATTSYYMPEPFDDAKEISELNI